MNTKKLALFSHPNPHFWLYFAKKLIVFLLINRCLENVNQNYEATGFIKETFRAKGLL